MILYIVLAVVGVLFLIFFTLLITSANKLKVLNFKIKEAENDVSDVLKDKYELLVNINNIMKTKGKEDFLKDIDSIDVEKTNSIELNNLLTKYDKLIIELTDYNKEIVFDEEEEINFEKLEKVNSDRLAIEKYYNDNAIKLNNSIDRFPASIISKIKNYDEKKLFSNEKEEIFEILKK